MEFKHEFIKIEKERFVTFMDAIIAIIMTIMVLEIKIPQVENLNDEALRQELRRVITPFIGFVVSFGSLVIIWIDHHDLMKRVQGITKPYALLNFLLLLIMAMLPFTTALAWGYPKDSLAVFLYALNLFLLSVCFAVLHFFAQARHLTDKVPDSQYQTTKVTVAISGTVILLLAVLIANFNPLISLVLTAMIPVAHSILIVFSYKFKN